MEVCLPSSTTTPAEEALGLTVVLRRWMVGLYSAARLAACAWLAVVLLSGEGNVLSDSTELAIAIGTVAVIASLQLAWSSLRLVEVEARRDVVAFLLITDQLIFSGLVVALGTTYGASMLLASVAPPLLATLIISFSFGLRLAAVNAVALTLAAVLRSHPGIIHLDGALREDWPVFAVVTFVYCIPAWMISRLLAAVDRLGVGTRVRAETHLQAMKETGRLRRQLGSIQTAIHGHEVAGLTDIVSTLRRRSTHEALAVQSLGEMAAELAADADQAAQWIRSHLKPLPNQPY